MKKIALVAVILVAVVVVILVATRGHRDRASDAVATPAQPAVVVVLDPAHGGRDPGTKAEGVQEKDLVLAIANRVSAIAAVERPDIKVVLTRASDVEAASEERLLVATREGAGMYLSLHVNAFDKTTVYGAETWVDSSRTAADPSWTLARSVQKAIVASAGVRDRGVKSQDLYLRRLSIPAASTQVGFLTSPEERAKLLDPAYQDLLARGILQGISDYVLVSGAATPVAGGPLPTVQAAPAGGSATRPVGSGS